MNIVGLGKAGCNIARAFSKFPQYNCITIDTESTSDVVIRKKGSHEEYDAQFPNLKRKISLDDEPLLVVTCGAGNISGGILQLFKQLKEKEDEISLLYIKPDTALLSETKKMQEKIVRNILQEYARSGILEMMYIVENNQMEQGVGEVPIIGYFDVLNQALVNTFHMLNVFKHAEPVIGNCVEPSPIARIATVGILDVEEEKENWFFDLQNVRDVVYYYGINEEELKTDGGLFKKITEFVKSKLEDKVNISYGVYKTSYEHKYCYCIKYSSVVQLHLDGQDIS